MGALVGFISLVILSPQIFTLEEIGLTQVMVAIATIIAQLGSLGFGNVTNRLFPYFRSKDGNHQGYLSLALLVTLLGFIISFVIIEIYMPTFVARNSDKSELLSTYAYLIPVLIGMIMLFNLLDNFCKVLFNAVVGTILREFVLRIINLILIVLYFARILDFNTYIISYVASYGIPVVVFVIYLIFRGEFRFGSFIGILDRKFVMQMLSLCLFGILAGLSGIALTNIDKYMVNNFVGLGDAGIYSIAVYFATLIIIPARSLGKISVPVIAEAWKRNDRKEIQEIYYKSSINQLAIGLLLFLGIICNLTNIFNILPPDYSNGEMVIIFFGAAYLIRVAAGTGSHILATSSYYRYQTYVMFLLVGLVIITNYIFIPMIGMQGAAIASLISITITTCFTIGILFWKFRIWPLDSKHLILIIVSFVIYILVSFLPQMSLILDILVRSLLIVVLYIVSLLAFKLSEEATIIYQRLINVLR